MAFYGPEKKKKRFHEPQKRKNRNWTSIPDLPTIPSIPADAANYTLDSFTPLPLSIQDTIPDFIIDSSSTISRSAPPPLLDSPFHDLFAQNSHIKDSSSDRLRPSSTSELSSPPFPLEDGEPKKASFSHIAQDNEISTDHKELFASGTQRTLFGKESSPPTIVSASPPKISSLSPSPRMGYTNSVNFGPYSLEVGQNTREANVGTVSSVGDEIQKDGAIIGALLEEYRQETGPLLVLDATTDKMAKQVMTALSNSIDQLSDLTAKQAQSTLDFLQDLLEIPGVPLSYKHIFLKTSLNLSRIYDCLPRRIRILRGFKKMGNYPFALGQFGELWRGEIGGTEVAVKQARIISSVENNIKEVLRKIRREAIIWGQCDHPNVLPFYGIYRDPAPSTYCLVSPFMVNGSLCQYLSNTVNPDRHRLGLDITRGTGYLHKMAIVHGDLKGLNILISDDHRAVIADFGISFVMGVTSFFGTSTSPSSRKGGTARWQAPEVLDGNPNSFSADVYSLACVYFEVFDGSIPWSGLRDGTVIVKVFYEKEHPPCPRFLLETDLWYSVGLMILQIDQLSNISWSLFMRQTVP